MIKTSVMFFAHAIHLLLRNTLIFFVVLVLALLIWIMAGIKIDTLDISHYRVDGLYLKYDKKLILKADKVIIPKRKKNPSFGRTEETLANVKYLLTFFEHIDLKDIVFDNNHLAIYFSDNILQISSKDYLIRGDVHKKGKTIYGDIPVLDLKKQHVMLRGKFAYDLSKDILVTEGKFLIQKASGDFRVEKERNKVYFSLKSDTFTDLKSIIDLFPMNASVKSWVVDKVQVKAYKLLSLRGAGEIVNQSFKMNMDALKGKVLFSKVNINFKEGLPPVKALSFLLTYSDKKGLFFDLNKPTYLDKNLTGSSVSIVNLRDENTTLKLNLKLNTKIDTTVEKLLKVYDINIPVIQKEGKAKASIDIDIGLKQKHTSFTAKVKLFKGDIQIGKVVLPVQSGIVSYKNGFVVLKDVQLSDTSYAGVINGKINLKKYQLEGTLDLQYAQLKTKDGILVDIKNKKLPFTLKYKNTIEVLIPTLAFKLKSEKGLVTISVADLNKIKKYISKRIPIEEGGIFAITTKDFKQFDFKGMLKRNSCFLYEKNNACQTRMPIRGKITKNNFELNVFDNRVYYNKKKSRIELQNINIDLKKFLELENKTKEKKRKIKKPNATKIVIIGKNSDLRYDEYRLITDSYDVEVKNNGNIKAIGSSDGDIIKFSKINGLVSLEALRIKDKVLHPLINFYGLQKGRYSLSTKGDPETIMKGEIIIEGGVMKNFKAYNNTIALINTLPALATLQDPGYSNEGFMIESGVIDYQMLERKKIIFDSIYIKGKSATIVGKGELNLENKTINIDLGIQVARELGKAIGDIPIVGYILVGKEKSITVGLKIRGSIDSPKVSASATKDILSYPLELIKRTMETPQHILKQSK